MTKLCADFYVGAEKLDGLVMRCWCLLRCYC